MILDHLDFENLVDTENPLNRGLVSWWLTLPNPRNTGTRFRDIARNNHGTLTNGPTWQGPRGRQGGFGSLNFDGSDDHVNIPDANNLDVTSGVTLGCWYRLNALLNMNAWGHMFVKAGAATWISPFAVYALRAENSAATSSTTKLAAWVNDGGVAANIVYGATTLTAAEWQHACFTFDGLILRLYLNGREDNNKALTASVSTSAFPLYLGSRTGATDVFPGNLDDFRIYNRALSASEVRLLYNDSRMGYPDTLRRIKPTTYFFPETSSSRNFLTLLGVGN